jgi:hypothetical protein
VEMLAADVHVGGVACDPCFTGTLRSDWGSLEVTS